MSKITSKEYCDEILRQYILVDPYLIYENLKEFVDENGFILLDEGEDEDYSFFYNPNLLRNDVTCGFDLGDIITLNDIGGEYVVFGYPRIDSRNRDYFNTFANQHMDGANPFWILSSYSTLVEAYGIKNGQLKGYNLSDDSTGYSCYIDSSKFDISNIKKISSDNGIINLLSNSVKQYGVSIAAELFMFICHNSKNIDLTGQTKYDIDKLSDQINNFKKGGNMLHQH